MIDPEKINAEELADIIYDVQRRVGYRFDLMEVFEIARHTVRKAELTGQDESYVPMLLENELRDFVMRKRINAIGGMVNVHGM